MHCSVDSIMILLDIFLNTLEFVCSFESVQVSDDNTLTMSVPFSGLTNQIAG